MVECLIWVPVYMMSISYIHWGLQCFLFHRFGEIRVRFRVDSCQPFRVDCFIVLYLNFIIFTIKSILDCSEGL